MLDTRQLKALAVNSCSHQADVGCMLDNDGQHISPIGF